MNATFSKCSDDESGDEFGPSYTKLASLATKQQRALEKVQNMFDESNDMLGEELNQTKALTDSLQRLQLSGVGCDICQRMAYHGGGE